MKIQASGPTYYNAQLRKAASAGEETGTANTSFNEVFQQRSTRTNAGTSNATQEKSANPFGVADADSLISAFRTWKESRQGRVGNDYLENIHDQADAFETLLQKASSEGGFADPIAFIQGLSTQERRSLQQIHCLAEPIAPGRLSEEGALNLLLPPNQRKDIDKNGYLMVGEAKTWVFPPMNAPEEVKAAWEQAVAESGKSSLVLQAPFMPSPFQENAYIGEEVGTYLDLIAQRIDGAKLAQKYDMSWQHEDRKKQIAFLTNFLEILELSQS